MNKTSSDIVSALPLIPYKFNNKTGTLEWCNISGTRFNDPFFEETLQKCLKEPINKTKFETPVDILSSLEIEPIKISGFIFHVSRCGSTLVSQTFSVLPQCKVFSEAPVIDEILYFLHTKDSLEIKEKIDLFKSLLNILGRKIFPQEKYFIIKFDSWHIEYFDFIRQVFPGVPCIFLYREPSEVISSHKKIRGMQMIPGLIKSKLLNINTDSIAPGDLDLYAVMVLENIFKSGLEICIRNKDILAVNYNELPLFIWEKLVSYFDIQHTPDNLEVMKNRSGYDAKDIYKLHTHKIKNDLPENIKSVISGKLTGYYNSLEKLRRNQDT